MPIHQGEVLRAWLKDSHHPISYYIDILGMTRQNLNHHLRKDTLTDDFIRLIKEKLKIDFQNNEVVSLIANNPHWPKNVAFKAAADKQTDTSYTGSASVINDGSSFKMKVPLVPQAAIAGYLTGYADAEFLETLPTREWTVAREPKGNYMTFVVRGDSMYDGSIHSYIEGDEVLGREIQRDHWKNKLHIDDWDFVIVHSDGIMIKKITKHDVDAGVITVYSLNKYYPERTIHLDDVIQLFNVVQLNRKR